MSGSMTTFFFSF